MQARQVPHTCTFCKQAFLAAATERTIYNCPKCGKPNNLANAFKQTANTEGTSVTVKDHKPKQVKRKLCTVTKINRLPRPTYVPLTPSKSGSTKIPKSPSLSSKLASQFAQTKFKRNEPYGEYKPREKITTEEEAKNLSKALQVNEETKELSKERKQLMKLLKSSKEEKRTTKLEEFIATVEREKKSLASIIAEKDKKKGNKSALHICAEKGYTQALSVLLNHGGDPNIVDGQGWTPLMWAIEKRDIEAVKILVKNSCNLSLVNLDLETALDLATRIEYRAGIDVLNEFVFEHVSKKLLGDLEALRATVKLKQFSPTWADSFGNTVLHIAVELNRVDALAFLLPTQFFNVNAVNMYGQTPLCIAAHHAQPDCVLLLLENSANPSTPDYAGYTPLHHACCSREPDEDALILCVKHLIKHGADVNAKDKTYGATPLHFAMNPTDPDFNMREFCIEILQKNPDITITDDVDHKTASKMAPLSLIELVQDYSISITFLRMFDNKSLSEIQKYFDENSLSIKINQQDSEGDTALHIAVRRNSPELVKWLLQKGASQGYKNEGGFFPKEVAKDKKNAAMFELLETFQEQNQLIQLAKQDRWQAISELLNTKQSVNPNVIDEDGNSALHHACMLGYSKVVEVLVDANNTNKVHINAQNNNGRTPLLLATWHGNKQCVKLLLMRDADLGFVDELGNTILHLAVSLPTDQKFQKHLITKPSCLKKILQVFPNTSVKNKKQDTPLMILNGLKGDKTIIEGMKYVYYERIFINSLFETVKAGNPELVLRLNQDTFFADVNPPGLKSPGKVSVYSKTEVKTITYAEMRKKVLSSKDGLGRTLLHWAAEKNNVTIARTLIKELGASVDAVDKDRKRPVELTTSKDVSVLFDQQPLVDVDDLMRHCREGNVSAVQQLVQKYNPQILVKSLNSERLPPLVVAIIGGDRKVETPQSIKLVTYICSLAQQGKYTLDELTVQYFAPLETENKYRQECALHTAVRLGRLGIARRLIECGFDPAAKDSEHKQPVHYLSSQPDTKKFSEWLDQRGFFKRFCTVCSEGDINEYKKAKQAAKTHLRQLKDIPETEIEKKEFPSYLKAILNMTMIDGDTLLHLAARAGHLALLEQLIQDGAQVAPNSVDQSFPSTVAKPNSDIRDLLENIEKVDILKSLMIKIKTVKDPIEKSKARDNAVGILNGTLSPSVLTFRDTSGFTILHWAVVWDVREGDIIGLLTNKMGRESTNIKDIHGRSVFHLAALFNRKEVLRILLSEDSNATVVREEDDMQMTPLMLASLVGASECVQFLCKYQADPNMCDQAKRTPLILAAMSGDLNSLNHLLELRPNCNVIDIQGRTALLWALYLGHNECAKALIEAGADVNLSDENYSPLEVACRKGNLAQVQLILDKRTVENTSVIKNNIALHFACSNGTPTMVKLLLEKGFNPNSQATWPFPEYEYDFDTNPVIVDKLMISKISAFQLAYFKKKWDVVELLLQHNLEFSLEVQYSLEIFPRKIPPIRLTLPLLGMLENLCEDKENKKGEEEQLAEHGVLGLKALQKATSILTMCKKGNISEMKAILFHPVEEALEIDPVNLVDKDGKSAVCHAAIQGNDDAVEALIQAGADVLSLDNYSSEFKESSQKVIKKYEYISEFREILQRPEKKSDKRTIEDMVDENPDLLDLYLTSFAQKALHVAARSGNYMQVQTLLRLKCDPNGTDINKKLPIHYAIRSRDGDCVKLLLEKTTLNETTLESLKTLTNDKKIITIIENSIKSASKDKSTRRSHSRDRRDRDKRRSGSRDRDKRRSSSRDRDKRKSRSRSRDRDRRDRDRDKRRSGSRDRRRSGSRDRRRSRSKDRDKRRSRSSSRDRDRRDKDRDKRRSSSRDRDKRRSSSRDRDRRDKRRSRSDSRDRRRSSSRDRDRDRRDRDRDKRRSRSRSRDRDRSRSRERDRRRRSRERTNKSDGQKRILKPQTQFIEIKVVSKVMAQAKYVEALSEPRQKTLERAKEAVVAVEQITSDYENKLLVLFEALVELEQAKVQGNEQCRFCEQVGVKGWKYNPCGCVACEFCYFNQRGKTCTSCLGSVVEKASSLENPDVIRID